MVSDPDPRSMLIYGSDSVMALHNRCITADVKRRDDGRIGADDHVDGCGETARRKIPCMAALRAYAGSGVN